MRNFARINNYYNKQAAWKDWLELSKRAHQLGLSKEVKTLHPKVNAGWRSIDKATAALRGVIEAETGETEQE